MSSIKVRNPVEVMKVILREIFTSDGVQEGMKAIEDQQDKMSKTLRELKKMTESLNGAPNETASVATHEKEGT